MSARHLYRARILWPVIAVLVIVASVGVVFLTSAKPLYLETQGRVASDEAIAARESILAQLSDESLAADDVLGLEVEYASTFLEDGDPKAAIEEFAAVLAYYVPKGNLPDVLTADAKMLLEEAQFSYAYALQIDGHWELARDAYLWLADHFADGRYPAVALLRAGMLSEGVGKRALAVECYRRVSTDYAGSVTLHPPAGFFKILSN